VSIIINQLLRYEGKLFAKDGNLIKRRVEKSPSLARLFLLSLIGYSRGAEGLSEDLAPVCIKLPEMGNLYSSGVAHFLFCGIAGTTEGI